MNEAPAGPPECTHTSSEPRRRVLANGAVAIWLQCLSCGKAIRTVPRASVTVAAIQDFDVALFEKGKAAIDKYYKDKAEQFEFERKNHIGQFWIEYNAYLNSEHWKFVRRKVIERDPLCQVCVMRPSVQAHHLTYSSFKKYGMSFTVECIGVCSLCHDNLHGVEGRNNGE